MCVAREQDTYKEWTVLGQVDLDSFVDAHVVSAQEFEENFKAVRARRREAEKLPEIIKVNNAAYILRTGPKRWTPSRFSVEIFRSVSAFRCCSSFDKVGCVMVSL